MERLATAFSIFSGIGLGKVVDLRWGDLRHANWRAEGVLKLVPRNIATDYVFWRYVDGEPSQLTFLEFELILANIDLKALALKYESAHPFILEEDRELFVGLPLICE